MRYAVYYSPSQTSLLHRLGSSWLGYNAYTGEDVVQPGEGTLRGVTEQASHYGLHATFKAPFHLKPGMKLQDVCTATSMVAQYQPAVVIPKLVLRVIDGFLALVPETQGGDLAELAAACVSKLDHLHCPPEASEIARRLSANLSPRQRDHLTRWGYPYVFEEFHFHITLTGKLKDGKMPEIRKLAEKHFEDVLDQPLSISALTTFMEAAPDVRMRALDAFALAANLKAADA
jgi:putative phosphonate metabolism protein